MPEEPCQCPDCQRFYREHDRLIRESPTLRQQQELSWAALQAFRTLSGRVLEDLQKQHGPRPAETQSHATPVGATEGPSMRSSRPWPIWKTQRPSVLDRGIDGAHFDVRVPEAIEQKFRELAGELALDPLNADRLRLNRLLHRPRLPDRS